MPTDSNGRPSAPKGLVERMMREQVGEFYVTGIPADTPATAAALLRSRLIIAANEFRRGQPADELTLTVTNRAMTDGTGLNGSGAAAAPRSTPGEAAAARDPDALSVEDRASYFVATEPVFTFDFLVLPDSVMNELMLAVDVMSLREQVFDKWNLRSIEPHPNSAINLHGPPGTGKTLAAHAIAHRLGKKILHTRYSQLESKYHGEGPKNLDALFYAARTQQAVLFLDEADSLMSQRFETTSQGSEHAVNAMRSELLMSLDRFEGLAIFATNFVRSYDRAFDSRVRHVRFPSPDATARVEIWRRHLPAELPLDPDVSVAELAAIKDLTGRDIRRAVIDAATQAARAGRDRVTGTDLASAAERVKATRIDRGSGSPSDRTRGVQATATRPGAALEEAVVRAAAEAIPESQPADEPTQQADSSDLT